MSRDLSVSAVSVPSEPSFRCAGRARGGDAGTAPHDRRVLALAILAVVFAALLGLAPGAAYAAGTWSCQDAPHSTDDWLSSVTFIDSMHGWAVGEDLFTGVGVILATANGGANWVQQYSVPDSYLSSVTFTDPSHGWAVGQDSNTYAPIILATTNGGSTWVTQRSGSTNSWLSSVTFIDSTHGWAVGEDLSTGGSVILATANGGAIWVQQYSVPANLSSVTFTDASRGWAVGQNNDTDAAIILATTNGGSTWVTQRSGPTNSNLSSVTFTDASHGWAVGQNNDTYAPIILATANGGATWVAQSSGATNSSLSSVTFTDATHGWTVGYDQGSGTNQPIVLTTTNGGATWMPQDPGVGSVGLNSVCFTDAAHGWAVGDSGTILAYTAVPTTTSSFNPATGSVYAAAQPVTLSPSDPAGLGIKATYYRVDSGSWVTGRSFTVSGDGLHTFSYYSVDNANNTETTHVSNQFCIDTTAPTTACSAVAGQTYTGPQRFTLTPTDTSGSGVAGTWWQLDSTNGAWTSGTSVSVVAPSSGTVSHTLYFYSRDAAGNEETPHGQVQFSVSAAPSAPMPVWRFYNFRTGTHFYTADPGEMANVNANMRNTYSLDGVGYTVNTANTANSTTLYRFYNMKTGTHFYTADPGEKANVENNMRTTYALDGPAYKVCSSNVAGAITVWRFYNFRTGTHFYTADAAEKANVENNMRGTYSLDGPGFYLAP